MKYIQILIGFTFCCIGIISTTGGQTGIKSNLTHACANKVDSFVFSRMKGLHIPGISVAVVKNGKIIYAKGYGYANIELGIAVQPESNFLIASITKIFTSVSIMMLWEQQKLRLEDSIGYYLKDLPEHWNKITIRQLLNHTSGLPSNLKLPPPCKFDYDPNNYTRLDYIKEVACLPLNFVPGTRWEYSSTTGYNLLGMMIEKISGESYWAFLKKHIFYPLSMNNSGSIDYNSFIANRVIGYNYINHRFENSEQLDSIGEYAAGGLISTVIDLAKFDAALYTGTLLKKSTLDMMFTNAKLNDGTIVGSYGLGVGLTPYGGNKRVGHTGGAPGFSSS